uniref:Variant surface glycoprotein 1125.5393 n=1 Tax=Trypanosoma brucei TaxID=5691 RepID=A0A1J0RCQ5_9TRYP|nr:variant surface glycoprotein 1125.5393 [Trypanosoma brucei]
MCQLPSVGRALCITLLCVCTKDGAQNTDDICGDSRTPQFTWDTSTNAPEKYSAVDAICKRHTPRKVHPELIIQKLGQLFGMLKTATHARDDMIHLGAHTGSQHCDKQATSACADFTKAYPLRSSDSPTAIDWEQHLLSAVEKLKKAEQAGQAKRRTEETIKALRGQVELVFNRTATAKIYATKSPNPVASPPICDSHKSNITCTKNNCKWKGTSETEGTCKPTEGEVQPNTETGEKAGGTTTDKCSEAKTPEACAAVKGTEPDGKNAVCGWITYIDRKGKIESACRSSSFLVNKKLDLMAAAFMILVAFYHSKDF